MKSFIIFYCLIAICVTFSFGQNNNSMPTDKVFKKVAWQYEGGLGIHTFDPDNLKASLKSNNYPSDLSGSLFTISYGIKAVFFNKLSAGLNFNIGSTSDFRASSTSVSLARTGIGLTLGYDILSTSKSRFSLNYGLGFDINHLTLIDKGAKGVDFSQALDQRTSHSLFSANAIHRISGRYDYLFNEKSNDRGVYRTSLGLEIGYAFAGRNEWEGISDGPKINNSGLIFNVNYAVRSKRYKAQRVK